jgi:REP element-mobilizing transposase RayT
MVRRNRVFLPYGVYHVYCRVSRGEYVFNRDEDASAFVAAVRWMIEADGLSVLAWALLSNHYHLVVRTAEIPLWRSMLRFQPRVTRGHNRRRQIFGPLWRDRYRARIVLNDKYYRQLKTHS